MPGEVKRGAPSSRKLQPRAELCEEVIGHEATPCEDVSTSVDLRATYSHSPWDAEHARTPLALGCADIRAKAGPPTTR